MKKSNFTDDLAAADALDVLADPFLAGARGRAKPGQRHSRDQRGLPEASIFMWPVIDPILASGLISRCMVGVRFTAGRRV